MVVVNSSGKWLVELVMLGSTAGIEAGTELLSIDGEPISSLPQNPNLYLIGSSDKWLSLEILAPGERETRTVKVQCTLPLDAWNTPTLQSIISEALINSNYRRLVTATIMYAHTCYGSDIELSEAAFNRAVTLAQSHLGTRDASYTMAVGRKAWFYLKQYLSTLTKLAQLQTVIQELLQTDVEIATDAHAKYIYELACTFINFGATKIAQDRSDELTR